MIMKILISKEHNAHKSGLQGKLRVLTVYIVK